MWSPSTKPFLFLHYFGFCFNRFAPILFPKSSPRKQNHKWLGSVHFSSNSYLTCDCIECYWVNWIVTPFRSVLPLNLVMEEFQPIAESNYAAWLLLGMIDCEIRCHFFEQWEWKKAHILYFYTQTFFSRALMKTDDLCFCSCFFARFDPGRFELWLAGSFFYTYCVLFYCLSVSFIDQSECFCS